MITDVPGILVGHWTDDEALTGCTVIRCPPGTVGAVDVRGGGPTTIGCDSLRPGTLVDEVHAVLLSGGSAFGLAAAGGVMRYLEEQGVGFDTGPARVPIVAGAVLFDLGIGDPRARPNAEAGYEAAAVAASGAVAEGSVGAGTGATVAKLPDPHLCVRGGLGTASMRHGDVVVGAIAVVNSSGAIVDEDGSPIAENRGEPETSAKLWPIGNTTLVCVATNARVSQANAPRLAIAAHDGIAITVRPAHTHWDGDVAFALATGEVEADWVRLPAMTADAVATAIRRGVRSATGAGGVPSVSELAG